MNRQLIYIDKKVIHNKGNYFDGQDPYDIISFVFYTTNQYGERYVLHTIAPSYYGIDHDKMEARRYLEGLTMHNLKNGIETVLVNNIEDLIK